MPAGGTELERVVLTEVRRIGRAIDALTERVEVKFDELRKDTKAENDKLELRIRTLELEQARAAEKAGSSSRLWGALFGAGAAGLAEAVFQYLIHH